jgi:hypothetical protein
VLGIPLQIPEISEKSQIRDRNSRNFYILGIHVNFMIHRGRLLRATRFEMQLLVLAATTTVPLLLSEKYNEVDAIFDHLAAFLCAAITGQWVQHTPQLSRSSSWECCSMRSPKR